MSVTSMMPPMATRPSEMQRGRHMEMSVRGRAMTGPKRLAERTAAATHWKHVALDWQNRNEVSDCMQEGGNKCITALTRGSHRRCW